MRAIVFAAALALWPAVSNAQTEDTTIVEPVVTSESVAGVGSPAETAPMPDLGTSLDGYRIAAISAGAVGGVIAANVLTGGMVTPVLVGSLGSGGGMALLSGGTWLTAASQLAVTAAGAVTGGYVGDWFYGQ